MQIEVQEDLALYIQDMCNVNGFTHGGFVNALLEKGIRQDVEETYGEEKARSFIRKLIAEHVCDWSVFVELTPTKEENEHQQIGVPTFQERLDSWVAGVQKKINDYFAANYPNSPLGVPQLEVDAGSRYVKIWKKDISSRSCFAFIDKNGDVLKAASHRAPAKHARGNIFDAYNGLRYVDSYGPASLR